ncbi:hypothetical protein BVX94_00725, partial [bacterium B17]
MAITVNDEKITDKSIEEEYNRLKPDYDLYVANNEESGDDEQLREWSIENLIERTVLRQEAMKSGEDIPSERLEEIYEDTKESFEKTKKQDALVQIEHQLRIERMVKKLQDDVPEPDENELRAYYKENKDDFQTPETIGARHIVKHLDSGQDKSKSYVEILNIK